MKLITNICRRLIIACVAWGWIDEVIKIVHIALTAYVTAFNEYNTSLNLHGRALILEQIAGLMVLVRWPTPSQIYSDTAVKRVQANPLLRLLAYF